MLSVAVDAQSRFYAEAYANAPKAVAAVAEPVKEKTGFFSWLKRLFRRKKK